MYILVLKLVAFRTLQTDDYLFSTCSGIVVVVPVVFVILYVNLKDLKKKHMLITFGIVHKLLFYFK